MSKAGPKQDARMAVRVAIRAGRLTPIRDRQCVDCGAPARDYDHFMGYEPEHYLSVQPVCRACHGCRTRAVKHPSPERTIVRIPRAPKPRRVRPFLTERQQVALRLIAEGASNRDIAVALHTTLGTVGNVVADLYTRLGVENRLQAALWYREHAEEAA